jgi:hypothetical protein
LRSACTSSPDYLDGVRWLAGEDAAPFGDALRDMWDPTCKGHPDRANSPLQTCPEADGGGVHSGSGIPNHAFAILTDGKTFNGQTVSGIGPIKAGAVWYRALTVYIMPAADFEEAYVALNQAAADLVGTYPNDPRTGAPSAEMFTAADAAEVDKALIATEMNTEGACGAMVPILDPEPPEECSSKEVFFADDFEGGTNGWTVANTGPDTPYDWVQVGDLPYMRAGTAWYCLDLPDDCPLEVDQSAVHYLYSPMIAVPADASRPTLKFTHVLAVERAYDGGNVKIQVDGGEWMLISPTAFAYNPYNSTFHTGDSTNPLASEHGWSGAGGGWGTSLIDLGGFVSGGETIRLSFEFGKDYCNGIDGWYVDDVELYTCPCADAADCDDGRFCTGVETCVGEVCETSGDPCAGRYCDEEVDACVLTAFWDDFEYGNVNGWSIYGPGSTASTGEWLLGNPHGARWSGEQAQPEDPFQGLGCAFTAQNADDYREDVDQGVVYLVSPTIDLEGHATAELSYARWFFQDSLGDDPEDFFTVDVSSDNGENWVNLETLGSDDSVNVWTQLSFQLEDFVSLTDAVKIRFGVSDGTTTDDVIEGAVDHVLVQVEQLCQMPMAVAEGCRCLAVTPAPDFIEVALRVTGDPGDPLVSCLSAYVQQDGSLGSQPFFQLPEAWATTYVQDAAIIPDAWYNVAARCSSEGDPSFSVAATTKTRSWGDVVPNGVINVADIMKLIAAYQGDLGGTLLETVDIATCVPDGVINISDIMAAIAAYQNKTYADTGCPMPCP